MKKIKKNQTLYKKFKTKYRVVAQTIKPLRKGLNFTAQTTAKVVIVATPVVQYLPFIGSAVGAAVGILDNTSTSLLSLKLPSVTDVVLPAAIGGIIGHQTKEAIKTISKKGLSNPLALAEVGIGTISLVGNLTLNPTPTPINTMAVVGGSMVATSVAKCCYATKKQMSSKELQEKHKKINKQNERIRYKTAKMVRDFEALKSDINYHHEDPRISSQLKQVFKNQKALQK